MAISTPRPLLVLLLALLLPLHAVAQSGPSLLMVPFEQGRPVELSAHGFFTPTQANVTGADVDLSISDITGRVGLDRTGGFMRPGNGESLSLEAVGFDFTQLEMSTSDPLLPDQSADVSLGVGGALGTIDLGESAGEWKTAYTVGVGYASTSPYGDSDGLYGKANLLAVKAIDRDTRWLVGLNYDGNRVFMPDVPLPAVTYFGRLNENTTYGLGFPFSSINWERDRLEIDVRSAVFFSFTGRVSYRASYELTFFAEYARRNEAFTDTGPVKNQRLFYNQQRAELGLEWDPVEGKMKFVLAGGYVFDQNLDTGFDSRDVVGLRNLDDAVFVRFGVEFAF